MKLLFLGFLFSLPSFAGDPASVKVKLYGAWMSKSEYCTLPVRMFDSDDANFLDFIGKPELGHLDNNDSKYNGTYKCIILKISETIKFAPKNTVGFCNGGQEYTMKICNSSISTINPESLETSSCSNSSSTDDTVFVYLSTAATSANLSASSNPFLPPTASNTGYGINLANPWAISGNYTVDLVVNAYDKVVSSGSTCVIDSPTFTFSGGG